MPALPATEWIENRTFDEIQIGESASLTRCLGKEDIQLFAVMSGDVNPAHLDEDFAKGEMFHEVIAHGLWGGALISAVLGTRLPGPGTIYLSQNLHFLRPVKLGDTLTVSVSVKEKLPTKRRVILDCTCVNQRGEDVIRGQAEVIAPSQKIKRPKVVLPEVKLIDRDARLRQVLAAAAGLPPVVTAVVYPCDEASLNVALEATRLGLIKPVWVGPAERMAALLAASGRVLAPFRVVEAATPQDAAHKAAALVAQHEAGALMQGALKFEDLLAAVKAAGAPLHTARRLSQVSLLDVPGYPKPLFLTDAGLNPEPDLEAKRDLVQNAIDLAQALGIEMPKVAIVAAIDTVSTPLRSTLDAAALCKMAQRGQIRGGLLDGPLAFDQAVSFSTPARPIESPVAGCADILLAPDQEAGTLLMRQLLSLADSQAASIVLGARAPIALGSPNDSIESRIIANALAMLWSHHPPAPQVGHE